MSNRVLLSQVYWPDDKPEQRADKVARLVKMVAEMSQSGDRAYSVVIRRHSKPRSQEANNYLWGVVYQMMSDASGYERDELHELMCGKFFGTKVVEVLGVRKRVPIRSTTTDEDGNPDTLPTAEFARFVDMAIREAAMHLDLAIPPPG